MQTFNFRMVRSTGEAEDLQVTAEDLAEAHERTEAHVRAVIGESAKLRWHDDGDRLYVDVPEA